MNSDKTVERSKVVYSGALEASGAGGGGVNCCIITEYDDISDWGVLNWLV